jgi:fatty-acyl-CoA synthase
MTYATSNIGEGRLTVGNILEHGARWHADRVVTTVGRPASVSFAAVRARAARLASGLAGFGVGPGTPVGSLLWNTHEHLEAYYGVPAMGALLHTINPRLFPAQIAYTINHAGDEVLIVDASFVGDVAAILPSLRTARVIVLVGDADPSMLMGWEGEVCPYEDLLASGSEAYAWPDVDERAAATLCFTTGTTGDPKGVAYSHRSIWIHAMSLCTANAVAVSSRDHGYIIVPMFHANAWGYPYANFWAGGDLLLCHRTLDPASIVTAIETHRPTYSNGVPTVWNDVLAYLREHPGHDISSLDRVVLGGAPIPRGLREGLRDDYGIAALQGWGMTETSPLVTLNRPPRDNEDTDPDARADQQGRVLAGVDVRLVEPETGEPLPADGATVGELELRGPWIADSYYGVDAPEKFHDGWLRTGDVGRLDSLGYVELTDRAKDVIKSGGEWISSVQLELELAKHPDVLEAAVIGVPDERWDERPCALVVLRPGATVTTDELRTFILAAVPRWWLPERFVVLDALPRTSVGKYDKKHMRTLYAAGELDVCG